MLDFQRNTLWITHMFSIKINLQSLQFLRSAYFCDCIDLNSSDRLDLLGLHSESDEKKIVLTRAEVGIIASHITYTCNIFNGLTSFFFYTNRNWILIYLPIQVRGLDEILVIHDESAGIERFQASVRWPTKGATAVLL